MIDLVPLVEAHLDEIVHLEAAAFAGRQPWTRAAFASEVRRPQSLWRVAVAGDRIAGYGGGWIGDGAFHLLNLATHRDHLRQGIGRALLIELLERSVDLGAPRATLEVRPENLPAIRLYESAGFTRIGERRSFYPDGGSALLMQRG